MWFYNVIMNEKKFFIHFKMYIYIKNWQNNIKMKKQKMKLSDKILKICYKLSIN